MADCTRAYRFEGIIRAVASHNVPVTGPSATAGAFKQTTTPQLNSDQAASRLALACLATAAFIVLARLVDALITTPPHIPDPISRLALLATLLVAAGLYASARLALLPAPLLIRGAIVFELLAVFSVAVAETGRPLMFPPVRGPVRRGDTSSPFSFGSCLPRRPLFILAVGVSAASTWLLGYVVNAIEDGAAARHGDGVGVVGTELRDRGQRGICSLAPPSARRRRNSTPRWAVTNWSSCWAKARWEKSGGHAITCLPGQRH